MRESTALLLAPRGEGGQKVFAAPAVRRLVRLLQQAGFSRICLLGRTTLLAPLVADLLPPLDIHEVAQPERLAEAARCLLGADTQRILVARADLIVDRFSLNRFLDTHPAVSVQGMGGSDGSFLLAGPVGELSALVHAVTGGGETVLPADVQWQLRDAPLPFASGLDTQGARVAESRLVAALAAQTAADDGFLARNFDRRISRFFSSRLARTFLTPNLITLGGVTIGLLGALLLSRGGYGAQLAGALLFLFCVIVDGVDGEVARLKLQESTFGHYLDVITDNLVHVFVFGGMAIGLSRETGNPLYLHALWFLFGGFGICIVAVYFCVLRRSEEEREAAPRALRLLTLLTNRDFAYLVVLLALLHRLSWFLLGASVGTYLFAGVLWWLSREARTAVAPRASG